MVLDFAKEAVRGVPCQLFIVSEKAPRHATMGLDRNFRELRVRSTSTEAAPKLQVVPMSSIVDVVLASSVPGNQEVFAGYEERLLVVQYRDNSTKQNVDLVTEQLCLLL